MKKTLLLFVGIASGLLPTSQTVRGGELKVVHSIDLPAIFAGSFGRDLAWDGEHLWTAIQATLPPDIFMSTTVEIDPADGSVVSRTSDGSSSGDTARGHRGYAWDGTHVWATTVRFGTPGNDVLRVVASELPSAEWASSRPLPYSPDARTEGAAWGGGYFWFSDSKHDLIMRTGTPIFQDPHSVPLYVWDSFPSPGSEPLGLAWDGESLWNVDGSDNMIYQMDASGNVLEVWSSPATSPRGLTFDGQHLWLLDNGTQKIYQLAVPEPSSLWLLLSATALLALFRPKALVAKRRHDCARPEALPFQCT